MPAEVVNCLLWVRADCRLGPTGVVVVPVCRLLDFAGGGWWVGAARRTRRAGLASGRDAGGCEAGRPWARGGARGGRGVAGAPATDTVQTSDISRIIRKQNAQAGLGKITLAEYAGVCRLFAG